MNQPDYFLAYHILKLTRDEQGILVVEFHTNDGSLAFTAQDHTEFVNAFYRISQDLANKIVIFNGTSGVHCGIDFHYLAKSLILVFGARCMIRECRFLRTWLTFACQ